MSEKKRNIAGFTLIELLLVVIVIGIVAVVAIPQFTDSAKDARESTLRANLAAMRNAVELYYHQHNEIYPGMKKRDGTGADVPTAAAAARLFPSPNNSISLLTCLSVTTRASLPKCSDSMQLLNKYREF